MNLRSLLLLPFLFAAPLLSQADPLAPLPKDGFVTLSQLVSDFSTQPDAAQQKYNGARLIVYGRVAKVAQTDDSSGGPLTVTLQNDDPTTIDVKATFPQTNLENGDVIVSGDGSQATLTERGHHGAVRDQEPFVTKGQMIGIRGAFISFTAGNIILQDCKKVTKEELKKVLQKNKVK